MATKENERILMLMCFAFLLKVSVNGTSYVENNQVQEPFNLFSAIPVSNFSAPPTEANEKQNVQTSHIAVFRPDNNLKNENISSENMDFQGPNRSEKTKKTDDVLEEGFNQTKNRSKTDHTSKDLKDFLSSEGGKEALENLIYLLNKLQSSNHEPDVTERQFLSRKTRATSGKDRPEHLPHRERLSKLLLDGYYRNVMPLEKPGDVLNVIFDMTFTNLIDVNEVQQSIETGKWIEMFWNDYRLKWNPSYYGGIDATVLPVNEVWIPDIVLLNSITTSPVSTGVIQFLTVSHVGNVRYMYASNDVTPCGIDMRNFPFDEQLCELKYGAATIGVNLMDLTPLRTVTNVTIFDKRFNTEWEIINNSLTVSRHIAKYSCCEEDFPDVRFTLRIKRRPKYYVFSLMAPTLLLCFVAIIGLFSPSASSGERTERINLGIATLLAMVIILMMITDKMPTAAEAIPLIGLSYSTLIVVVSVATLSTIITMKIDMAGNDGKRLPYLTRKIAFGIFARITITDVYAGVEDRKEAWSKEKAGKKKSAEDGVDSVNNADQPLKIDSSYRDVIKQEWRALSIIVDRIFMLIFLSFVIYVAMSVAFPSLVPLPSEQLGFQYFQKAGPTAGPDNETQNVKDIEDTVEF